MIDLPVEEAIRLATSPNNGPECRWNLDAGSQILEKAHVGLMPTTSKEASDDGAGSDYHQRQFELLTDYVSFLEN